MLPTYRERLNVINLQEPSLTTSLIILRDKGTLTVIPYSDFIPKGIWNMSCYFRGKSGYSFLNGF